MGLLDFPCCICAATGEEGQVHALRHANHFPMKILNIVNTLSTRICDNFTIFTTLKMDFSQGSGLNATNILVPMLPLSIVKYQGVI